MTRKIIILMKTAFGSAESIHTLFTADHQDGSICIRNLPRQLFYVMFCGHLRCVPQICSSSATASEAWQQHNNKLPLSLMASLLAPQPFPKTNPNTVDNKTNSRSRLRSLKLDMTEWKQAFLQLGNGDKCRQMLK